MLELIEKLIAACKRRCAQVSHVGAATHLVDILNCSSAIVELVHDLGVVEINLGETDHAAVDIARIALGITGLAVGLSVLAPVALLVEVVDLIKLLPGLTMIENLGRIIGIVEEESVVLADIRVAILILLLVKLIENPLACRNVIPCTATRRCHVETGILRTMETGVVTHIGVSTGVLIGKLPHRLRVKLVEACKVVYVVGNKVVETESEKILAILLGSLPVTGLLACMAGSVGIDRSRTLHHTGELHVQTAHQTVACTLRHSAELSSGPCSGKKCHCLLKICKSEVVTLILSHEALAETVRACCGCLLHGFAVERSHPPVGACADEENLTTYLLDAGIGENRASGVVQSVEHLVGIEDLSVCVTPRAVVSSFILGDIGIVKEVTVRSDSRVGRCGVALVTTQDHQLVIPAGKSTLALTLIAVSGCETRLEVILGLPVLVGGEVIGIRERQPVVAAGGCPGEKKHAGKCLQYIFFHDNSI